MTTPFMTGKSKINDKYLHRNGFRPRAEGLCILKETAKNNSDWTKTSTNFGNTVIIAYKDLGTILEFSQKKN